MKHFLIWVTAIAAIVTIAQFFFGAPIFNVFGQDSEPRLQANYVPSSTPTQQYSPGLTNPAETSEAPPGSSPSADKSPSPDTSNPKNDDSQARTGGNKNESFSRANSSTTTEQVAEIQVQTPPPPTQPDELLTIEFYGAFLSGVIANIDSSTSPATLTVDANGEKFSVSDYVLSGTHTPTISIGSQINVLVASSEMLKINNSPVTELFVDKLNSEKLPIDSKGALTNHYVYKRSRELDLVANQSVPGIVPQNGIVFKILSPSTEGNPSTSLVASILGKRGANNEVTYSGSVSIKNDIKIRSCRIGVNVDGELSGRLDISGSKSQSNLEAGTELFTPIKGKRLGQYQTSRRFELWLRL